MKFDKATILAIGLGIAAAIIRIPALSGVSAYANEERLRDLNVLVQMHHGILPLLGPVSVYGGFHFGPIYYYLYYPIAWLFGFRSFALAAGSYVFSLIALICGGYLCFLYTKNQRVVLAYGALSAFSAFEMLFASYGSNPNVLPLFAILFFIALYKLRNQESAVWYGGMLGLAFGIGTQLHIFAYAAFIVALLCSLKYLKWNFQKAALAIAGLLATYIPYAYFEFRNSFPEVQGLWHLISAQNVSTYSEPFIYRLWQCAAAVLSFVINMSHEFSVVLLANGFWVVYLAVVMIIGLFFVWRIDYRSEEVTIIASFKDVVPNRIDRQNILVWICTPILLGLLPIGRLAFLPVYYFTFLIPGIYIGLAICFERLYSGTFKKFAIAAMVCYVILQIIQIVLYKIMYH